MNNSNLYVLTVVKKKRCVYQTITFSEQEALRDLYEYCESAIGEIGMKQFEKDYLEEYRKYVILEDDDKLKLKRDLFVDKDGHYDGKMLNRFFPHMCEGILNGYVRIDYSYSINKHELSQSLKHKKIKHNEYYPRDYYN